MLKRGGIVGAEASVVHADLIAAKANQYDQRVSGRIALGSGTTVVDYFKLLQKRAELISEFEKLARDFDAILLPTVPIIAPKLSELDLDEDYFRLNGISLRNTYIGNMLNACAIAVPTHQLGHAPTSMMVMAPHGFDQAIFSAAKSII